MPEPMAEAVSETGQELSGQVAFVTGGATGIGQAIARRLVGARRPRRDLQPQP